MVFGEVRKKKARVMWKREIEVRIVLAEMSAIFSIVRRFLGIRSLQMNVRSLDTRGWEGS